MSQPRMTKGFFIGPLLWGLALGMAALGATGVARPANDTSVVSSQLPDMGTPADSVWTKSQEQQVGRMVLHGLRQQNQLLDDPEVGDYLQHLGSRIAAQTRAADASYQYLTLRDSTINAFAVPGGFIFIHSGLFLLTNNESELASVIAHETAHVQQRHIARAIQAQSRFSLASTAAMLAAILIGAASGGDSQAMLGGIALGQGVALQQSINFTRSEEAEADRVGIGFLADAGFNTAAMPAFFEEMLRREGVSDAGPLDLLRDHPVTSERIAESRTRAQQYAGNIVTESPLYSWMRERVRVASANPETDMTVYYARLRDRRALTDPERYGEALAQLRQHQAANSVATLRQLLTAHANITALYGSLGTALIDAGQQTEALTLFERSLRLFPRNVPLSMRYAEALMKTGKAKTAHGLLLDLFNNVTPTPEQIRLTALAASAAGDAGDASYYMSEYYISSGDLPLANQQLELALAAPNLTGVQRQRFRARLEEIREWLREQQQQRPRGGGQQPQLIH